MGDTFTPDDWIMFEVGFFRCTATVVFTWVVMAILVVGSWLVTRRISPDGKMSRWQNLLELVVGFIRREIRALSNQEPDPYVPFVGTLFIFIAVSALLDVVPVFMNPMASLSTGLALAVCVFVAVPVFGVLNQGVLAYLKNYVKPSPFMLPFNIVGEVTRTFALAVRLFGNMLSGARIIGVLLAIVPYIFPVAMMILGLLLGMIQAYIFAILSMVYIASGLRGREAQQKKALARAERAEATKDAIRESREETHGY